MVDEVNKGEDENNIGEEYQLLDENQYNQDPINPGEEKRFSNLLNKLNAKIIVVILIGALLGFLAIYQLTAYFMSRGNHETNMQPVEQVEQPVVETPSPVVNLPPRSLVTPDNIDGDRLSTLENQVSLRENEINSLIINLSSIQNNFDDLTHLIQSLQLSISNLSEQVTQQQIIIEQLQEEKMQRDEDSIVYYIQAIIPGRAWLKGSDGSTLTVRTGSEVPGYGTVSAIDVNSAMITIETGEEIGYDPNDS